MNPLFALLMNIFFQMNGINLPFMNMPNNNMNQNPLMNLFKKDTPLTTEWKIFTIKLYY